MKNMGLILGFVPLIVYGIFAGTSISSITLSLAAATAVTLIVCWKDLKKGMILSWTNLLLFGCTLVLIGGLGFNWLIPYMGILIYAILSAVSLGSILAGKPFTLQYAREMTEKTFWENPNFIKVNVLMTGAWSAVFLVNFILMVIIFFSTGNTRIILQAVTYLVLVSGIIFTVWYPGYVRKKYAKYISDVK